MRLGLAAALLLLGSVLARADCPPGWTARECAQRPDEGFLAEFADRAKALWKELRVGAADAAHSLSAGAGPSIPIAPPREEGYSPARRGAWPRRAARPAGATLVIRPWMLNAAAALLFAFVVLRARGLLRRGRTRSSPLSLAAETPPSGLGEIQVLRTIGRGGMGVVYEGFDTVLRRRVALKKLRPEIAEDPREVEEFLREARTVAGLSHPNIVQIHTVLRHGKGVYLVFEYADGQTLDDLLAEEERLAPERALPFLDQIAAGLDYAHARDVVHRDLKPANVIISADGKAKIADFGMARVSRQSSARWSRSRGGGTPPYMAPEQALGEEGPPADIFALGACAYELLSGKRPYADGAMDLKRLRAYAPLSSFGAELAGADSVIARALDPEPARRQASAGAFAAELRAALGA